MRVGYYWAHRIDLKQWMIVEVVERLPTAVLDRGYAVKRTDYSAFVGPLEPPPSEDAQPRWVVPATMRRAVTEE